MIQFFARVVELREGKIAFASESVKYDGKVTTDSPSREFLEVTNSNEDTAKTADKACPLSLLLYPYFTRLFGDFLIKVAFALL